MPPPNQMQEYLLLAKEVLNQVSGMDKDKFQQVIAHMAEPEPEKDLGAEQSHFAEKLEKLFSQHASVSQTGQDQGMVKMIFNRVENEVVMPAIKSALGNAPEPKPEPDEKKDLSHEEREQLKRDAAEDLGMSEKDFNLLPDKAQDILIAEQLRKGKEGNENQAERKPDPNAANKLMHKAIVGEDSTSVTNRVLGNTGNEAGMPIMGATGAAVLQGELNGALSNVVDDVKSRITEFDSFNGKSLAGSLAQESCEFYKDRVADKEFNEETFMNKMSNATKGLESLKPGPQPKQEEEQQHSMFKAPRPEPKKD